MSPANDAEGKAAMKERKTNPKRRLAVTVLWTLAAAIWITVFVRQFSSPGVDTMQRILTAITLLGFLVACISNWCACFRFYKKET